MKKHILALSTTAALLTGCGSTPPPTPEEQAMVSQMRQAFLSRLQAGSQTLAGMPAQQQPQPQQVVRLSEQELAEQKTLVAATGGPAIFYRVKDGIKINGEMFNDFEGQVANFGGNRLTGEFTYAVKNFDGTFSLKYHRAGSDQGPVKIATVQRRNGKFNVETVTGKTIPGDTVIPTSDGFIVGRPGSAFRYVIGQNQVKSITLLDNYHIAQYQNGDVASTGYILLEKNARDAGDQVGGLMDKFKDLGNTFGLNQVDDYVLISLNNGDVVPMDISMSGKNVARHSGCTKKSAFHNECDNVEFEEALYTKLGLPNNSHYYWSVNWVDTTYGPLAFYRTSTKIKVVDIHHGLVHTLFSRALGVNHFTLLPQLDGTVGIEAKLGFSNDKIDDVIAFIKSNQADVEPMQKLGE